MGYESLLTKNLIKPFKATDRQIRKQIELSGRDLKAAILFAELALGEKFEDGVHFFNKMRTKRNQAVYDTAGLVSEEEAKQSLMFAKKFVGRIEKVLKEMRRDNRTRTIHASLAIENNTLTLEQVSSLRDGKRVMGLP